MSQRIISKGAEPTLRIPEIKEVCFTDHETGTPTGCIEIESIKLDDYFGNTINTASRMESKVATPNNIAFSFSDMAVPKGMIRKLKEFGEIRSIQRKTGYTMRVQDYSGYCRKDDNRNMWDYLTKRSGRLLSHECLPSSDLKGVKGLKVFVIEFEKVLNN